MCGMNQHKYRENNRFTCKTCQDIFNKYGETDRPIDEMDECHEIIANNKRGREEEEEEEDDDLSYNEYADYQPKISRKKDFDDMSDAEQDEYIAKLKKEEKDRHAAYGGKKSRKKRKGKSKAKKSRKGKSKAKKSKKTKKRRRTRRK